MGKIILVTGGQRSGKSTYAEKMALDLSGDNKCIYMATAKVWDDEFAKRVALHKQRRGEQWINIEEEKFLSKHNVAGKVVLIDFTIYNNTMSATHNLALRELYNKYHEKGLEIYQISLDADEHFWKTSADNLPWICVRDEKASYSNYIQLYNVTQLPTIFLVDRSNSLNARGENIEDLEAAIQKLL
jgi:peroxiredoxin